MCTSTAGAAASESASAQSRALFSAAHPSAVMGNLLTSPAQLDAARSAGAVCSSAAGAPVVAGPGPSLTARAGATRPPSAESVEAAARAGIAGAAEQRSSLPTRPAQMWAELGDEERAFVRRCFRRLVSAEWPDG